MLFAYQKRILTLASQMMMTVSGYNLFRTDHPSNTKRRGVCIYYRNSFPLKILRIQYLQKCINFEITIGGNLCRFASLHC